MKEKTSFLCRIGLHRPLFGHEHNFVDCVSGKSVYNATCNCGKKFMVDSRNQWLGFKCERTR